jgi:hypothetical protein
VRVPAASGLASGRWAAGERGLVHRGVCQGKVSTSNLGECGPACDRHGDSPDGSVSAPTLANGPGQSEASLVRLSHLAWSPIPPHLPAATVPPESLQFANACGCFAGPSLAPRGPVNGRSARIRWNQMGAEWKNLRGCPLGVAAGWRKRCASMVF